MALLNLIARLGLDTSDFISKLGGAEARANIFAKRFQSSLKSGLTQFATVGFAVSVLRDVIQNAEKLESVTTETAAAIQKLRRGFDVLVDAGKSGLAELIVYMTRVSTNPVLGIFAKGLAWLGEQFPETKKWETPQKDTAAGDLAEKKKRALKDLGEVIDRNNLKELSDQDRKVELLRRELFLLNLIKQHKGLTELQQIDIMTEAHKLRGEAAGINPAAGPGAEFRARNIGPGSLDPLARIGGFTGGAEPKIISISERIARATETTAQNTGENAVNFP